MTEAWCKNDHRYLHIWGKLGNAHPLFGKDRLIVNTWFTQILLIVNRNQLPFPASKLFTKGQLYVAQMGILLTVDTKQ